MSYILQPSTLDTETVRSQGEGHCEVHSGSLSQRRNKCGAVTWQRLFPQYSHSRTKYLTVAATSRTVKEVHNEDSHKSFTMPPPTLISYHFIYIDVTLVFGAEQM